MKKFFVLLALFSLVTAASCGGGGGTSPTTTSTETKVATAAATQAVIEDGGQAIIGALGGGAIGMVVGTKASGTPYVINDTEPCTDIDGNDSGSFTVTGTATANCTSTACTDVNAPVTVAFTDCAKTVTLSGTTYNEVLNGSAETTATGSVSGDNTGPTAINVSGTLSGTVTLTGDVAGEADLSHVTYTVTGGLPEPDLGCGGTAEVTITGASAQTCTVAEDCEGCES